METKKSFFEMHISKFCNFRIKGIVIIIIILLGQKTFCQDNTNKYKKYIQNTDKVARNYLSLIFDKEIIKNSIILDEYRSLIINNRSNTFKSLSEYKNNYKATSVWLVYDFIYKNDTIYFLKFDINDSLKITKIGYSFEEDIQTMIGWSNVLSDKFKFNYDKLKEYIKNNRYIDTTKNEISLIYETVPNFIINNDKTFIETKYYWEIILYAKYGDVDFPYSKYGDGGYSYKAKREIHIDTNTGKVITDKPIEDVMAE